MSQGPRVWTTEHFEQLSWHDNHVHGIEIVEGAFGAGELILDLDFIEEWLCEDDGRCRFRIQPVALKFHEVTNLEIELSYRSVSAALGPFSIHAITRRSEQRERYVAQLWTIEINWPKGQIRFEAAGFTQERRGVAVVSDGQCLGKEQRGLRPTLS